MSIVTDYLINLYKQEGIRTVAIGGMLAKGSRDKRRAKQKARRDERRRGERERYLASKAKQNE